MIGKMIILTLLCLVNVLSLNAATPAQTPSSPQKPFTIGRKGWDYDRAELTWPHYAKPDEQKKKDSFGGANGWVEYEFEIPKTGWYELWEKNGVWGWPRDIFIDGEVSRWMKCSQPEDVFRVNHQEAWYKEMNLYLEKGKHTLRIQRLGFPGVLPSGWELRAGEGRPEASIFATKVKQNVVRADTKIKIGLLGGAPQGPLTYTIQLMRRENDGETATFVKNAGVVEFPATEKPIQKDVDIEFPAQGVYFLVAKSGDKEARPADIDAGKFIVIDTKNPPPPAKELKTTPVIEIDCVAQTINGKEVVLGETFFEKDGATTIIEKSFGKYRQSSGEGRSKPGNHDPLNLWGLDGFSYKFDLPDKDHVYKLIVTYPDDAKRSIGFWTNDGMPNIGDVGLICTGGVETGGTYQLSNGWLKHEAFFYPRNTKGVVVAAVNLNKGSKAAAGKIVIEQVDSALPACPGNPHKDGRMIGFSFEEGPRWRRFFGAEKLGDGLSENLRTLDLWGQWNRYLGVNLMFPTVSVYGGLLYPSRVLAGYYSSSENIARMAALMAEKYGEKYIAELYLCGKLCFDKYEMGAWVEIKEKNGKKTHTVKYRSPDVEDYIIKNRDGKTKISWKLFAYNPLHPTIQKRYIDAFGELADQLADCESFSGICTRLMLGWQWQGWDALPGMNWGYGDWTMALFTKETGINVPGAPDNPKRFRQRFEYLTGPMKEKWIEWRCEKIFNYYCKLRDRLRQAKPDAKLYINYYGPDPREAYALDVLGQMREIGLDWRKFENEPGFVFIQNAYVGRRFSTPVGDAESRDPLFDPSARQIAKLGDRGFGVYTSYYEVNENMDWEKLGAKFTHAFDSCAAPGVYEREYYALAMAEADTSVFVLGGNGWMFGTPPVMQPFIREYRALPMARFKPFEKGRDPVAVWYYKAKDAYYFYAVNRLPVSVNVTLTLNNPRSVISLGENKPISLKDNQLNFTLEPFMLRSFKAHQNASLNNCETKVLDDSYLAKLPQLVKFARKMAEDVRTRQIAPEMTNTQAEEVLKILNDTIQSYEEGKYAAVRTNLARLPMVRLYNMTRHFPPGLFFGQHNQRTVDQAPVLKLDAQKSQLSDIRSRMVSINDLTYDTEGRLWAASPDKTSLYDHQGNYLKTFVLTKAAKLETGDARHSTLGPPAYATFTRLRITPDKRVVGLRHNTAPTIFETFQGRLLPLTWGNSIILPQDNGKSPRMMEVLAVDSKGDIYIVFSDPTNRRGVWKYHPDGTTDYAFEENGIPTNRFANVVPNDIAFDSVGNAYLAVGANIQIRNAEGKLLTTFSGDKRAKISRLAVSPDGRDIVAIVNNGYNLTLIKADSDGSHKQIWTISLPQKGSAVAWRQPGSVTVGFQEPTPSGAVALNYRFLGNRNPIVDSTAISGPPPKEIPYLSGSTQLKKYNGKIHYLANGKLWCLSALKNGGDQAKLVYDPKVNSSMGIIAFAFDKQGNLYLASNSGLYANRRGMLVYQCLKKGDTWEKPKLLSGKALQDGWNYMPTDIEFDGNDNLILRLKENEIKSSGPQVSIFRRAPDGNASKLAHLGPSIGWGSYGLHMAKDGTILIAGGGCQNIVALSPDGQELWRASFNKQQDKNCAPLREPIGITTDSKGRLWVTDEAANQIVCLSPKGETLAIYGQYGSADKRGGLSFCQPRGIATLVDESGAEWLYVADVGNQRIVKFIIEN